MSPLDELKKDPWGDGESSDHRYVNAAADDHDRHPECKNPKNGNTLQKREQICPGQKGRYEHRKQSKEHDEDRKDDRLLGKEPRDRCFEALGACGCPCIGHLTPPSRLFVLIFDGG